MVSTHPFLACAAPSRRDLAVAASFPIVAVPPDGGFTPLAEPGRRLVVSNNGLMIEAKSVGLHVLLPVAPGGVPAYGEAEPFINLPHGPIPRTVMHALADHAAEASPNEMAALLVVAPQGNAYEVRRPESSAHHSAVTYNDTGYPDGALVLDAHSHGRGAAFFSGVDDQSDFSRGGPHISLVFGECGSDQTMQFTARACIGSYLIALEPVTFAGLFA